MRVAGLAALSVCLATAPLAQAPRAESSTDGGPWLEDGTIKHQRLR